MHSPRLLTDLERVQAIMRGGHFVLTSGKHARDYVRKDAAYLHPSLVQTITELMAGRSPRDVDVVAGPVVGGVILSTWVAYHLSRSARVGHEVLSVFADKGEDGKFVFKRGYDRQLIGKKTLYVEDVVTTGGSLRQAILAGKLCGADVIGAIAMCNRGGITAESLGVPLFTSLLDLPFETWTEEECTKSGPCSEGVPVNTDVGHGAAYLRRKAAEQT